MACNQRLTGVARLDGGELRGREYRSGLTEHETPEDQIWKARRVEFMPCPSRPRFDCQGYDDYRDDLSNRRVVADVVGRAAGHGNPADDADRDDRGGHPPGRRVLHP